MAWAKFPHPNRRCRRHTFLFHHSDDPALGLGTAMSASEPSLVTVTIEAAAATDPAGRGELGAATPAMALVEKTKRRRLGTAGATQVLTAATANAATAAKAAGNPKPPKRGVRKIRASAAAASSTPAPVP